MSLELNWLCSGSTMGDMVNVVNPRAATSADAVNGPAWNLWWMKECLKQGGWTVVSSSDSQSTGSSDLWGSTFDETIRSSKNSKIFYSGNGSAHSWIALKAPSGSASDYYFIIDYSSLNVNSNQAQFTVTKGPISTGSTTTRPTGSADFGINNSVSTAGAATTLTFFDDHPSTTAQHRVNFHYTTDGAFIFSEVQVGKGKFSNFISFLPLQNTHAVDQFKWVLVGLDVYSGNYNSTFYSFGTTGQPLYTENSNAISGRTHNGSAALTLAGAIPAIIPEGSSIGNGILFINQLTAPNGSDSTYSDFPIVVVNAVGGPTEMKGRLPDMTWTSNAIPNGAVSPVKSVASDTYERVKYLSMWLPWTSKDAPVL